MRSILRAWPGLDPRTGIAVFALWAALFGLTLVGPGDSFQHSAIYGELRLHVEERPLGLVMLASAAAMVWSIHHRASMMARLVIGAVNGTLWLTVGGMLIAGAADAGTFTGAGLFAVLGGAGSIITLWQWMSQP